MKKDMDRNGGKVEVTIWSSVRKPLTYIAPVGMAETELLGRRVVVSVGNRKQVGVITGLDAEFEGKVKSIDSFPDLDPVLTSKDIAVCRFLAEYYFASLGECIRAFLPNVLTAKLRQRLRLTSRERLEAAVSDGSKPAAALLTQFGKQEEIAADKAGSVSRKALLSLIEQGIVALEWETRQSRKFEPEQLVSLRSGEGDRKRLGVKAGEVLQYVETHGNIELSELRRKSGASSAQIESLRRRGLIELREKSIFWEDVPQSEKRELQLTTEQQAAVDAVGGSISAGGFSPFLLYGVTGSGKTEVYLRAIRQVIEQGGSAIVIVPEIGLSQAIFFQLQRILGSRIGLVHSRLSDRSRLQIWQQARRGELSVVLGPRSAVFSPLLNLKLIVVDEEQDQSLKQESPAPRYHARDVALYRGKVEGCTVLLGSATPSVESFYNAASGKYQILRLSRRVDRRALPKVSTVSLKSAFEEKHRGFVSSELSEAIERALGAGGQVMLLLNRRGFAPSVHCHGCGQKFTCHHCAVTLVYHKGINELLCHTCGYREPYPTSCPTCGSNLFLFRGIGTEKLHEELRARFPEVKVLRMDLDSTRNKGSFKELYDQFHSGEAKILIGTQMIAKGFDFPDVALVGVVSADTALELPDFRARERTLQLLTQAAGRAGRLTFPGEVLLQTLHPEDITVAMAAKHDYEGFYQAELAERQALNFPPFSRLILVSVESSDCNLAEKVAGWIAAELDRIRQRSYQVLGPTAAPIFRRKTYYRFHLLLKTGRVKSTLKVLERVLSHKTLQNRRKLSIIVDVDAIDMI